MSLLRTARLQMAADPHLRSLDSEIIAGLELGLSVGPANVEESLRRARELRERYSGRPVKLNEIEAATGRGQTSPRRQSLPGSPNSPTR